MVGLRSFSLPAPAAASVPRRLASRPSAATRSASTTGTAAPRHTTWICGHRRRRAGHRGPGRRVSRGGRRAAVRDLRQRLGPLTALVNNAGILETQMRVETMDAARLQRVFATNVIGAFLCAREAVRRMSTRHGGPAAPSSTSRRARRGSARRASTSTTPPRRARMDTLTIGLAREVAEEGIRVNAVRPGFIYTDIHASGGEPEPRRSGEGARADEARRPRRTKSPARSSGCCPTRPRTRPARSSTSPAANEWHPWHHGTMVNHPICHFPFTICHSRQCPPNT